MPARKKFDKLELKPEYSEKKQTREYSIRKKNNDKPVHFKLGEKNQNNPEKKQVFSFKPAFSESGNGKTYAVGFIYVYIPFLVAFVFSLIISLMTKAGAFNSFDNNTYMLLRCILYPVTLIIPMIVYCKVQGKNFLKEGSLHRFSISLLPFIILGSFLLMFSAASVRLTINYVFPTAADTNINLADESNILLCIISYSVIPAICEELLLRGLVQNGISEKAGGITGITVSAICFALIHFDPRFFTVYLCAGIILAVCAHVTNSVIPCIIMHIFASIVSLFVSARLSFIASERAGSLLIIILLVLFTFILLLLYIKSIENTCVKKAYLEEVKNAEDNHDNKKISRMYYRTPFKLYSSEGYTFHKFLRVLFSPAIIVSVIIFLFATL